MIRVRIFDPNGALAKTGQLKAISYARTVGATGPK